MEAKNCDKQRIFIFIDLKRKKRIKFKFFPKFLFFLPTALIWFRSAIAHYFFKYLLNYYPYTLWLAGPLLSFSTIAWYQKF